VPGLRRNPFRYLARKKEFETVSHVWQALTQMAVYLKLFYIFMPKKS